MKNENPKIAKNRYAHPDGYYWVRSVKKSEWVIAELSDGILRPVNEGVEYGVECAIGDRIEFPVRPMHETKWYHAKTKHGVCKFIARPDIKTSNRKKIVFIHGLARSVSDVAFGFDLAEQYGDVVLMSLPGFSSAEMIKDPTVTNIGDMYLEALSLICDTSNSILVGESLGGLIALSMSNRFDRAIVIEPPISMENQWPIREMANKYGIGGNLFPSPLYERCMGSDSDEVQVSYMNLIHNCKNNVCFIVGDVPLMPPRKIASAPSLVKPDEVDLLRSQGRCVEVVPGGHDLIREAMNDVARILVREMRAAIHAKV